VNVDAHGGYTVLLGDTSLGGLPPDLFASSATHWIGVQAAGQPEGPRILLVELSPAHETDPISPSSLTSERASPISARDRNIALILLIMFLIGALMACGELRKWWKTRTEQYGEPPVNLLRFVPTPDKLRRAAQVLREPLSDKLRSIRGRFERPTPTLDHSTQSIAIHIDKDRPTKAA
jgi:hypothetical protein